jgi:sugar-specific transcriptional regulator TrmB
MKLYLTSSQRNYLLEILRASENNAVNGKDAELAEAFNEIYEKIKPTNTAYVNLNRGEAETIVEFCDIVRRSLDEAISFLNKDKERDKDEVEELKDQAIKARDEIEEVTRQLQDKIRNNPV